MSVPTDSKTYPINEALSAQRALRQLAGLKEEMFSVEDFVGMISDEVEELRKRGHSDEEIARTINNHSAIQVTGDEIAAYYASPEQRHHHG